MHVLVARSNYFILMQIFVIPVILYIIWPVPYAGFHGVRSFKLSFFLLTAKHILVDIAINKHIWWYQTRGGLYSTKKMAAAKSRLKTWLCMFSCMYWAVFFSKKNCCLGDWITLNLWTSYTVTINTVSCVLTWTKSTPCFPLCVHWGSSV